MVHVALELETNKTKNTTYNYFVITLCGWLFVLKSGLPPAVKRNL